ncbi:MAG TPA: HIT family protein [Kofleriaceae bacterium]|nr:HIT family protein [Kofleriaceae bacterium]
MARCVFCQIVRGEAEATRVYEDADFIAFMDIYPMRPGHVLVCPREHVPLIGGLPAAQPGALFELGVRLAAALRTSGLPCDDVNFVLNDGPAASQTVPHVHLHLVPRTRRDLGIVLGKLMARPVQPLLGAAPRAVLEQQAAAIRAALGVSQQT